MQEGAKHLMVLKCQELGEVLSILQHLFATRLWDLGCTNLIQKADQHLGPASMKQQVRRYPLARQEEELKLVKYLLAIGLSQESTWSSPTVLVNRRIGEHVILHQLPPPQSGHEGWCLLLAACRRQSKNLGWRLFLLQSGFGQRLLAVLQGIVWLKCLVYLDDILVFGPDFAITLEWLTRVLDHLGEAWLKLNWS